MINEAQRVHAAYEKRKRNRMGNVYSFFNKAYLQMYQQRERVLLSMLERAFGTKVADKRVLDIGCGMGGTLLPMLLYGFNAENCFGVDILPERIEIAQNRFPLMTFECASAESNTFPRQTFDLVVLFTCLSSILSDRVRKNVCQAAEQMLKPDGWILVYDFVVNNPRNPDVRAVTSSQLRSLFEKCSCVKSKKLTLVPPLARLICRFSYLSVSILSCIPFLQTHRMSLFQIREKW